jgi:exosortase A
VARILAAGPLAVLAIFATGLAFWPVFAELFALWWDTDRPYSHGLLVGPIALWLTVRNCVAAKDAPASPSAVAVVLFLLTTAVWLAAYGVDVLIGQELLLPVLLVLAVAAVAGWAMARKLAFPIGFVYFAIPVWSALTLPLQEVTVAAVSFVLDLVAIPVYVEGNLITIPEGVFEVAGGCSGLHFFIVALTLASLHAHRSLQRVASRVWLLIAAIVLAMLTNWIRVGSLVAIGHYSDMQHYLITHEHYYYGWVLFALALIPLFFVSRHLVRVEEDSPVAAKSAPTERPATTGTPRWRVVDSVVAGLLVVSLALPATVISANRSAPDGAVEIALPSGQGEWMRSDSATGWRPSFEGAHGEAHATYVSGVVSVDVYLAVYLVQTQGRELVAERNRLFVGNDGALQQRTVALGEATVPHEVREQVAAMPRGRRRVAWFWYAIGDRVVTQDLAAKLWQVLDSLGGRDSAGIVAVSVECADDCEAERARLQAFLQSMGPLLATAAARQQRGSVD